MTFERTSFLRINLLVSSRFGESLRLIQDDLDSKNFYAFNAGFDKKATCL